MSFAIRQLPLRRRCWSCSAATTPCKLSQRETCCKLAEAVIGDHAACRMSVLAVAEHVACSFSCFICTPSGVRIDCPCMSSGLNSIGLLTKEPCEELLIHVHYTHINALQLVQAEPRPLHGAVHSPPGAECTATPCSTSSKRLKLGNCKKFHVGARAPRRRGCSPGWSAARAHSPTVSGLFRRSTRRPQVVPAWSCAFIRHPQLITCRLHDGTAV